MGKFYVTPKGLFEEYADDLFEGTLKAEFPIHFSKENDTFEITEREIEEKLSIKFARMPLRLFQETLAFLEWCHKEKKSEGFVAHRYIDGKWENAVFPQWNGSASVCYHPELLIEKSTRVVGDTHSHPPSYGSTHSHTDGLDERKNNGIFVVVKGFTPMSCDPEIIGCVRGRRFHLKPESLFDLSEYDPKPKFPDEWKDMVGGLPCKGCERRREADRKTKEVSEKKEALEYERKYRLVPKQALEVWRTEVVKDKETLGKKLKAIWDDYKKKMPAGAWPRVLRCDNHGCFKATSSPKCDECQRTIGQEALMGAFIDVVEEWQAFTENPEELALILGILEEDAKKPSETQKEDPSSQPSTSSTLTSEVKAEGSEESVPHILLVASDKACGKDCPYSDVPHQHSESRQALENAWKSIVHGTTRENCTTTSKRCLYPERKVCDNGCVWSEAEARNLAPSSSTSREKPLPSCKMQSCKDSGHVFFSCDIGKAIEEAKRYCPSKNCELSGHSWATCDVKVLKTRLVQNGDLSYVCDIPSCSASGHVYLNCPVRVERDRIAKENPEACTSEACMKGNHYFASCPIFKQRNVHALPSTSQLPAPPVPPCQETVVVGDSVVCSDSCQFKGKPHRHEMSKAGSTTTATPASGEEEAYWGC